MCIRDRYKGGLSKWVQDYENAFSELHKLGVTVWEGDEEKKRRIIQNATHIGISSTLMSEIIASNRSFVEVCKFLHSHATQQEYAATENRMRNIMRTRQTHSMPTTEEEESTETKDAWVCRLLNMPVELWDKLDNDTKKWFIAERRKMNNERAVQSNKRESTRPKNNGRTSTSVSYTHLTLPTIA